MTVGQWLDARRASAPPHLIAEVRTALGADLQADARQTPERCVEAAERVVARLLAADRTGRDSALALLAADALVTYAFEAAAEAPDTIAARAAAAMRTLAVLS